MNYRKYLISSPNNIELVKEFVEWSLKGYTFEKIDITEDTLLIDTLHTVDELSKEFDGLDVKILDVTDANPFEILQDLSFAVALKVDEAIKKMDISNDINHFLELVETKGSVDLLNGKERQRLYELTNQINLKH